MVSWDYFDKFEDLINKYMPCRGEGETKASQIVTAVNKLVYKWYNDGDVYDNTRFMKGWMNDLSSFANWLYKNTDQKPLLMNIFQCEGEDDYENLLQLLADNLLDADKLTQEEKLSKVGSIYDAKGPFRFEEPWDDDDDDEWNDEDD